MKNKVLKTIKKYNLIENGDKLVLGVSGGPDSIAMLNILNDLRIEKGIELDFNIDEKDCITIPVYDNDRHKQKPKKNDKRKQIYEKEERKLRKHNKLIHDDDYEL